MENQCKWKDLIRTLPIRESYYSLNGELKSDSLILDKFQNKWKVYYFSERGSIHDEHIFETEDDACHYIYTELKKTIERAQKYGLNY